MDSCLSITPDKQLPRDFDNRLSPITSLKQSIINTDHLPPSLINDTMPSDDYTSISRGPLKLKGAAGVTKKKKKKSKDKATDLEKNLSTGGGDHDEAALVPTDKPKRSPHDSDDEDYDTTQKKRFQSRDKEEDNKTETERRFAEAKRKRVRNATVIPSSWFGGFEYAC